MENDTVDGESMASLVGFGWFCDDGTPSSHTTNTQLKHLERSEV